MSRGAPLEPFLRAATGGDPPISPLCERLGCDPVGIRPVPMFESAKALPGLSDLEQIPGFREHIERFEAEAERAGLRVAQEQVEAATGAYYAAVARLDQAIDSAARRRSEEVVDLALAVAEALVGHELSRDREQVVGLLDRELAGCREQGELTVRMNPLDREHVLEAERPEHHRLELVADPELGPGEVIIESQHGVVDACVATRLAAVRDALVVLLEGEDQR